MIGSGGEGTVFGVPDLAFIEQTRLVIIQVVLIAVDHGAVASVLDNLAEGAGIRRSLLCAQGIGASPTRRAGLVIIGNGILELAAINHLQALIRLLDGFLLADRLGKEVHPHIDSLRRCIVDIPVEILVFIDPAIGDAAVSASDHGELDPIVRHIRPFDISLGIGYVDAETREPGSVCIVGVSAIHGIQASPIIGALRPEMEETGIGRAFARRCATGDRCGKQADEGKDHGEDDQAGPSPALPRLRTRTGGKGAHGSSVSSGSSVPSVAFCHRPSFSSWKIISVHASMQSYAL